MATEALSAYGCGGVSTPLGKGPSSVTGRTASELSKGHDFNQDSTSGQRGVRRRAARGRADDSMSIGNSQAQRCLAPSPDPVDQALVVGWIQKRELRGIVPITGSYLKGDEVYVVEQSLRGVTLGEVVDTVHDHITTAVALSFIERAAHTLAELHQLDVFRPPIHGQLSLDNFILGEEADLSLSDVQGFRGDPQLDIQALLNVLSELLLPKAAKPGGAELLYRLSTLKFSSALDLANTIHSHLARQSPERLMMAKRRFAEQVFLAVGGPQWRPEWRPESRVERSGSVSFHSPQTNEELGGSERTQPGMITESPESRVVVGRRLRGAQESHFASAQEREINMALEEAFGVEVYSSSMAEDDDDPESATETAVLNPLELLETLDTDLYSPPTALTQIDSAALSKLKEAIGEAPSFEGFGDESPFEPEMSSGSPVPRARILSRPGSSAAASPAPLSSVPPSVPRDHSEAARDGLMAPAAPRETKETAILVGEYRVVAGIGKGGMGEIYLARSVQDDRLVALKVLGASESGDEEALGMLMDEAAIMARIEHPHVLRVLDFGRAHDRYYLASEYLEGRPLVRVMVESHEKSGGMNNVVIACLGLQAARGLHAAHTATTLVGAPLNVVHRDVSPQNIFVTYQGEVKVIDFGVARAAERFSQTQIGLVKGKAAYMSPEQAEGSILDARSDVFSLGACLWELVAGKRLFKRTSDYDTLIAVQTAPIEAPSIVRSIPDPELDAIIMGALRRDLTTRTASAEILAKQLEDYLMVRGALDGGVERISAMMDQLFHEEAQRERAIIHQLEARSATEDEANSLRELSGVSHHGDNSTVTFVADADGLDALEYYGLGPKKSVDIYKDVNREETAARVIRKVREAAEQRTGDLGYSSSQHTIDDPTENFRDASLDLRAVKSSLSGIKPKPPSESPQRLAWMIVVGSLIGAAVGVAVIRSSLSPESVEKRRTAQMEVTIRREDLVRGLRNIGVRVKDMGSRQRVEGLGGEPFELNGTTTVRWIEDKNLQGWLLEVEPTEGGPGVVWIARDGSDTMARGLSVNDCPAHAHLDNKGLEIDYGPGFGRVELSGGRLADVVLAAPKGADRLEIRPLSVSFGRRLASSSLTHCKTGWRKGGRVVLRRLPEGSYQLRWLGPDYRFDDQLEVTAAVGNEAATEGKE